MDLNESRGDEMGHRRFAGNPYWAPALVQSLLIYLNVAKYTVLIIPFPAILTTAAQKAQKRSWKSSHIYQWCEGAHELPNSLFN
jgi:hypothetical protein